MVVGPEAPLVAGVADAVRPAGIPCFGPSAEAAALEGSKAFAKDVMAAAGGADRDGPPVHRRRRARRGAGRVRPPYVVKDDGLAAGKGVVVTQDRAVALEHGEACLARREAANERAAVVVEEFLDGPEVSLFCVCDGQDVVPLAPAQDFKRALDGDLGPNTGGMGAYSPLPWAPADLVQQVVDRVARPTVDEMRRRGTPFVGVLYCGLALTVARLRVVEFNARFGDPETQVVLARLATPLAEVLMAAATGEFAALGPLRWRDEAAVTVVVAAHGYPGTVRAGDEIEGVADADALPGVHVLHAGTARSGEGALVSAGGRVLSVVGVGADLDAARERAYAGRAHRAPRVATPHRHRRAAAGAARAAGPGAERRRARRRDPPRGAGQGRAAMTLADAPVLPGWTHVYSGKVRDLYLPAADAPRRRRRARGRERQDQRLRPHAVDAGTRQGRWCSRS